MDEQRRKAAEVLCARTHFAPAAAERFVAELEPADVDVIVALGQFQFAKAPLNSFLDVLAARQQVVEAEKSPEETVREEAAEGVRIANKEFTNGLKAAKEAEKVAAAKQPKPVAAAPPDPTVGSTVPLAAEPKKQKKT